LALILLAGFMLRLVPVFSESYWLDEAITANALRMPLREMTGNRLANQHSPFYFVMLHPWASIFGNNEAALRMPSVLAALAALWVFWLMALRFFARRWQALLAVFLLAINTPAIHYAHEARMYSFVLLATLLSFHFFWRLQKEEGAALWLGYGAASLANLYLSVTTLPFLFVHGLWILARRHRVLRFAACWAVIGSLYLPMAVFYSRLPRLGVAAILPPLSLKLVAAFFRSLWIFPFYRPAMGWLGWLAPWITVLFLFALAGLACRAWRSLRMGVPSAVRGKRQPAMAVENSGGNVGDSSRAALLTILWFAVPLGMHVGYSLVRQPVFGWVRYLLGIVPAYVLILAWGAGWPKGVLWRKVLSAALVLLFLLPLPAFFSQPRRPDWRHAFAWIEAQAHPGDILTGSRFISHLYKHYRRYPGLRVRPLAGILDGPAANSDSWVILADLEAAPSPEVAEQLRSRYRSLRKRKFPHLVVWHLRSR
jgi:uncharacterized membrane protein